MERVVSNCSSAYRHLADFAFISILCALDSAVQIALHYHLLNQLRIYFGIPVSSRQAPVLKDLESLMFEQPRSILVPPRPYASGAATLHSLTSSLGEKCPVGRCQGDMRATHGSAFVLTCSGRAHHRVGKRIPFSADAALFMQQQVAPKLIKLLKSCLKNGPRDSICFSLPSDPGMLNAIATHIGLTAPIQSSPSRGCAHVRVCFDSLILPCSNSVIAALLI
jgi:hypothetical protein